jgi:hexosaminidase
MEFVRTIWRDLAPLFSDANVFIGGDECHTTCWADNPNIAAWARSQNLTVAAAEESVGGEGTVFGWYIDQMVETVHGELGKRPNMWSPLNWDPASPPQKLVSSNAILNLWTGDLKALAYNMTLTGTNDVVTSVGWYLPSSAYTVDPASYCESNDTQPYYCSDEQRKRIIGGEACMWGEGTDKTNFFAHVWPDLTMVAEKLWSGPTPQGGLDLLDGRKRRLRQHRCRLVSRGVPMPGVGSEIYTPDASHASFSTWRESSWCPGDERWGAGGGTAAPGAVERAAAKGENWVAEALVAATTARSWSVGTPFDS